MMLTRKRCAGVLAAVTFAICVPAASAEAFIGPNAPCSTDSNEQLGATAGTANSVCQGSGLSFIGPSVGQVAAVMGPTIIGPSDIGTVVVSAGDVAAG
jgi:hypothetical protein